MKLEFKEFIYLNEKEQIDILNIRNSAYVRENMINSHIIEIKTHLNWIKNLEDNQNSKYFAIFFDNSIVGSVYFTISDKEEYFWGIYIDKKYSSMISVSSAYIFIEFLVNNINLKEIFSLVRKSNPQAINFNKNFGFKSFKEDNEFIYLKLSKDDWENQKNSKLLKPIKRYLDKIEYQFKD